MTLERIEINKILGQVLEEYGVHKFRANMTLEKKNTRTILYMRQYGCQKYHMSDNHRHCDTENSEM